MPDPINPNPVAAVPSPTVQPENPPPENVTLDMSDELDNALAKSFAEHAKPNEEKPAPVENKAPSEKPQPEPKKSDKPVPEAKPLPTPESLDKDAPKKQDGWTSLKNNYTRLFKEREKDVQARDSEISKLKASLAEKGTVSQKEVDGLKSQIEELSKFRAMVDIQADPEFVSKYDQPIEKSVGSIKEMLQGMNVSQEIIDQIDFTNTKLMDEVISHVGQHKDNFTARKLQRKVEELLDLSEKRDETLSDHKTKHKEYIENKKKETFNRSAEDEGKIIRRLEEISVMKDKNEKEMFPFLKKMELKENGNQLENEQAENHNRMVDLMSEKIQSVLAMKTPEQRAEVAVAAVASHYLTAQLRTAAAKIASLENELKKISAVSTETASRKAPGSSRNVNPVDMNLDEALSEHLNGR